MGANQYFPFERNLDPRLYDLYVKKLPMRGWAGQLSKEERAWLRGNRASLTPKNPAIDSTPKLLKQSKKQKICQGIGRARCTSNS